MNKTNGEMQLESLQQEIDACESRKNWSERWTVDGWTEWGDKITNEVWGEWSDDMGDWPMNSWTKGKYTEFYLVQD